MYGIFIFFELEISKLQKLIPAFFLLLQLQSLTGGLTSLFGKKADPVTTAQPATVQQPAPVASGGMFSGLTSMVSAPAAAAPVAAAPAPVQPAQPVTLDFIPGLDDEPVPAAKPAAAAAKPATSEAGGLLGGLTGGLTSGLSNLAGGAGAATGKLGDAGGAAAGAVGGVLKMGGGMFKKFGF